MYSPTSLVCWKTVRHFALRTIPRRFGAEARIFRCPTNRAVGSSGYATNTTSRASYVDLVIAQLPKQARITQTTQSKSQIAQIRRAWRYAQSNRPEPREAHNLTFRVIRDLICVICVILAFLPNSTTQLTLHEAYRTQTFAHRIRSPPMATTSHTGSSVLRCACTAASVRGCLIRL